MQRHQRSSHYTKLNGTFSAGETREKSIPRATLAMLALPELKDRTHRAQMQIL
jgi:hypothetical protein